MEATTPGEIDWDIRRAGRSWTPAEFTARASRLLGMDLEISEGKLLGSDESRLLLLGMLLEGVGLDAAVRLGDPERWRAAVAALPGGRP